MRDFSSWSRKALNQEARRLGIWAPGRFRREELIAQIEAAERSPVRRAGRFLRRGVKFAVGLTPFARLMESESQAPAQNKPGSDPRDATGSSSAFAGEHETVKKASAVSSKDPKAVTSGASTTQDPPSASSRDSRQSTQDLSDTLVGNEPLPTRTMARLLAEQGHLDRAQAIYWKLQKESPDDTTIAAEFEALAKRPLSSSRTENAGDEIVFASGKAGVVVAWTLAEATLSEARAVCGGGELVLRAVVVRAKDERIARRILDSPISQHDDTALIEALPGARVTAAIGFLDGDRFFSVLHAPPYEV